MVYPPALLAVSHSVTHLAISGCCAHIKVASGNATPKLAPLNRWETFLGAFVLQLIAIIREKLNKRIGVERNRKQETGSFQELFEFFRKMYAFKMSP